MTVHGIDPASLHLASFYFVVYSYRVGPGKRFEPRRPIWNYWARLLQPEFWKIQSNESFSAKHSIQHLGYH